jgi:signal transduction histidine kinase
LLESERLASPHAALHREPVGLAALAEDVLAELHHLAPPHTAAPVEVSVAEDLPEVLVDRTRIRLLLRNLLDNALRHNTGALRPPELSIHLDEAGSLCIAVRDHGPGVPEQELGQLGDAFYRPDAARTREGGGVGLGLTLCKLVAQAHGGSLAVRNAHPGLEVRVTLPTAAD